MRAVEDTPWPGRSDLVLDELSLDGPNKPEEALVLDRHLLIDWNRQFAEPVIISEERQLGHLVCRRQLHVGRWQQAIEVKVSDTTPGDGFGEALGISGTLAVVGSAGAKDGGHAYILDA